MITLKEFWATGISIPLLLIFAVLGGVVLIVTALYKKDRVKTGLRLRSFGFYLEASGNNRKGEKNQTLKG